MFQLKRQIEGEKSLLATRQNQKINNTVATITSVWTIVVQIFV